MTEGQAYLSHSLRMMTVGLSLLSHQVTCQIEIPFDFIQECKSSAVDLSITLRFCIK